MSSKDKGSHPCCQARGREVRIIHDQVGQYLPGYYERQLHALDEMGCPIDRKLFSDLVAAEQRLGPPEALETQFQSEAGIRTVISIGSRRPGFEILRDVITRHRRNWSQMYLESYLRYRWETELKETAREVNRFIASKGKPPTVKQFAGFGIDTVNHWFGGDISDAYSAFGEKSPITQERMSLMPVNRVGFALMVFQRLGEQNMTQRERFEQQEAARTKPYPPNGFEPTMMQMGPIGPTALEWIVRRFADAAPNYVQLQEALGRPPTPKELGADHWCQPEELDVIWPKFVSAIEDSLPTARAMPPWRHRDDWDQKPGAEAPSRLAGATDGQAQTAPERSGSPAPTRKAEPSTGWSFLKRLFGKH